jgi:acetyl esterase
MPLAPPLARLIEGKLAHTTAQQWEMPIAAVRDGFAKLWTPDLTGPPVPVAAVEDRLAGTVPVRVYHPQAAPGAALLMYFHGGGWVKGGLAETDAFCRRLAHSTGRITVSVEYRLAPEHPFPAALDDVWAATSWAYAHAAGLGGSPDGFAVCGESAGGNLAAVVSQLARSSDSISIDRQILLQPVTDLTLSCPSIAMPETECLVPRADLAWYYRQYAGTGADLRAARLSPLWATDLEGLPPALIIAAEYDSLRDEADAYAQRLGAAGVEVRYRCYPGMVHGFLQMAGLVPDAQQAIDEIAAFLRR